MIASVNDLEVYRRSKELYPKVIAATKLYPPNEFHLRDQTCRAANGIHACIAEGFGRSVAEFKMYLTRALGSCNETISHLDDAVRCYFVVRETGTLLIAQYTNSRQATLSPTRTMEVGTIPTSNF